MQVRIASFLKAVVLVAVIANAIASLRAQDPSSSGVTCRTCASDGRIDCNKHGKVYLAKERQVEFCSVAAACKACAGALEFDCKDCQNPVAEAAIEQRKELVRKWREDLRTRIDEPAKAPPLLHLRTAHLELSYGIEQITVGRDKLDAHAGMHLYAERIEALRDLFLTTLELGDADFTARLRVYMCADSAQNERLAPVTTGLGGHAAIGTKYMGIDAVYCMWPNPRSLPDDEAVHRNIVHNVSHLLISNMKQAGWFGNPGNGWVSEGLASWFEDKVGGKCTNYCFEEVLMQDGASYKGGRWRVPVRKIAEEGKLVSVATLAPKNGDQLVFVEHAQSFAMVDHLMVVHGGKKMRDFLRLLKTQKPMRDAMAEVYGFGPLQFDTAFATWVKATYPLQERPR